MTTEKKIHTIWFLWILNVEHSRYQKPFWSKNIKDPKMQQVVWSYSFNPRYFKIFKIISFFSFGDWNYFLRSRFCHVSEYYQLILKGKTVWNVGFLLICVSLLGKIIWTKLLQSCFSFLAIFFFKDSQILCTLSHLLSYLGSKQVRVKFSWHRQSCLGLCHDKNILPSRCLWHLLGMENIVMDST